MQVVVSVAQPTMDALAAAVGRARGDVVEARLDRLAAAPTPADVGALVRGAPIPLLVTVRAKEEGGEAPLADDARAALLLAAIEAGAHAVDVEAAAPFRDRVLAAARARGVRVVLSSHDLVGTPPATEILRRLRAAAEAGAWVGKVAVTFRGPADAASALEACLLARRGGLPYAVMAVNDATLRLFGPALGQALVYARPEDAPATAPGQVTPAQLARIAAQLPSPTARTRPVFLLGSPVEHSASPAFQNAAFRAAGIDATFLAADVAPENVGAAVRALPALGALGANVTMPHKEAVIAHCEHVSDEVRAARAANVLIVRDGEIYARNTDGDGALAALATADFDPRGKLALVLGAGGTARAIVAALVASGSNVVIANRTHARAVAVAEELTTGERPVRAIPVTALPPILDKASLLVNATSVGLDGQSSPLHESKLRPHLTVLDCPYRRGGTRLLHAARAAGCVAVPGEEMLLQQGALAFSLWTGRPAPHEAMRAALAAHLEASS